MENYDKFSAEDNYPQKKHKKIYAQSKKSIFLQRY